MAWWSKVRDAVEKHDGPRPKVAALIRINFAVNLAGHSVDECGLYKRDPAKYPDEPNVFPAMVEKARAKRTAEQIRAIMKKGRRS